MSTEIAEDRRYLDSHEWAKEDGETVTIGISDFAQDELGDVVFVELPETGETIETRASFGVIESIKAVSDIYAPVSGTVTAVNDGVIDAPELVNEDPYGEGWLIEVEGTAGFEDLLTPGEYRDQLE